MQICVVGIGYVGLVTSTCLAEAGNNVVCVDNDDGRIAGLKNGVIPIYEPSLAEMVKRNVKLERLEFTSDLKYGLDNSLVIFIAVGTPMGENHEADLRFVTGLISFLTSNLSLRLIG